MKRALMAIAIAAIVGTGVYGLAASLNVTSATLGAGNVAVAACQAAQIKVTYTPTYSASGYQATSVHLLHVDETAAKCGGKDYKVTLTDNTNASLGEGTGTITASLNTDATEDVTLSGNAAAITGVHVVITG